MPTGLKEVAQVPRRSQVNCRGPAGKLVMERSRGAIAELRVRAGAVSRRGAGDRGTT